MASEDDDGGGPVIRGRLHRIEPLTTHPRASEPPAHDGPDSGSMAVLDGPTARRAAQRRQRAAREALQERPAASTFGPVYTLADEEGYRAGSDG